MGLFDLFNGKEEKNETNIVYVSVNEVSVIIRPKIQRSSGNSKIIFYDLSGNRVPKIPRGKRDISIDHNCYLGLKKYNNSQRWEPIKSDEVQEYLNDKKFILDHSVSEKKSKKTQKIKEEKFLVEKSTKDIEDLWTRIQNDITEHRKTTKLIEQEKTRIEDNKEKIRNLKRSILIESTIEKLPSQGIGSIEFYNNLNQKKTLYDNNQFSNIIRFLSHIENTEKNYRTLYLKSHKSYINSPGDPCHNLLLDTLGSLNVCYQLSEVLINEIDRDTVLFSKVYNKLEDQGYFLNDIEKFKIKNLISISNSLLKLNSNINNLSNVLREGFESIEYSLNSIDNSVQDVSIETGLVGDSLKDIESRLYDM